MGKSLIIKGVDFSSVAVEQVELGKTLVITPSWVTGYRVKNDATVESAPVHKYALVEIPSNCIKIQSRIALSIGDYYKDLIFMNGSNVVSVYPTSQSPSTELCNLFIADIPTGSTSVYVNYMSDSRAAELGLTVMNTITFIRAI